MAEGIMNCPLGLDTVHRSSCYFYLDGCHCNSLPGPLLQVFTGKARLLAWPDSQWAKSLDDSALEILERVLNVKLWDGLGGIQIALLRSIVLERICRQSPGPPAS